MVDTVSSTWKNHSTGLELYTWIEISIKTTRFFENRQNRSSLVLSVHHRVVTIQTIQNLRNFEKPKKSSVLPFFIQNLNFE
jgi:hypothetical protein